MCKSIALAVLIVLLLTGVAFQHYITSLPDLEEPVSISEAWLMTDGGSISASFVDREGYEFHFGIRGNLETDKLAFPLFYIRNPKMIPYVYWPTVGGPDEREFLRYLEGWINRNVSPEMREKLKKENFEGFGRSEMELAVVYRIYEILQDRNQP